MAANTSATFTEQPLLTDVVHRTNEFTEHTDVVHRTNEFTEHTDAISGTNEFTERPLFIDAISGTNEFTEQSLHADGEFHANATRWSTSPQESTDALTGSALAIKQLQSDRTRISSTFPRDRQRIEYALRYAEARIHTIITKQLGAKRKLESVKDSVSDVLVSPQPNPKRKTARAQHQRRKRALDNLPESSKKEIERLLSTDGPIDEVTILRYVTEEMRSEVSAWLKKHNTSQERKMRRTFQRFFEDFLNS